MTVEKFPSVVGDIMSHPVSTVDKNTLVKDVAEVMTSRGIGSVIITQDGTPKGIVTKRDIIQRLVTKCGDPCQHKAGDIMSSPLITTQKDNGILNAMRKMREKAITQIVVMDGFDMVGIVSERDMIRAVSISSLASFTTLLGKKTQT